MKRKVLVFIVSLLILTSVVGVVMAVDPVTTTAQVTVNAFLSVTLSDDPVAFPDADPLETVNANVGGGYPLTLTNDPVSNVNVTVETKADGTHFCTNYPTCDTDKFAVQYMKWSDAEAGTYLDYTTNDATVCASVARIGTCDIYHQLQIPSGQAAGTYSTAITITATQV